MAMSRLLTIPQELRDEILKLAIDAGPRTPPTPEQAQVGRTPGPSYRAMGNDETIHYETEDPVVTSSCGLLRTCKALYRQTKEIMGNARSVYKLDVLILKESAIYPTWLAIPILSDVVEEVEVTFRISGSSKSPDHLFRGGYGEPPSAFVWCLYQLLVDFFKYGPFRPTTSRGARDIVLHKLSLRCVSDTPKSAPDYTSTSIREFSAKQRGRGDRYTEIQGSALALYIAKQFRALISMGYCMYQCDLGPLLHDHLGAFTVQADDPVFCKGTSRTCSIQMNRELLDMEFWPTHPVSMYVMSTMSLADGHCRIFNFWDWKYNTICRRQAAGLMNEDAADPGTWPRYDAWEQWKTFPRPPSSTCSCTFYHGCENSQGHDRPSRLEAMLEEKEDSHASTS